MSLKRETSFGPLFLSLLLLCFSIASCGGIVSAPNEKLKIVSTFPASGATDVDKNIPAITVLFNKEMDPASLNKANFLLKDVNGLAVEGGVVSSEKKVTFRPTNPLIALATYTATLTSAARDFSGDSIGQDFSWTFTLSNVTDTSIPFVVATNPENLSVNIPLNFSEFSVTFSKSTIDRDTVIANTTLSLNHGTSISTITDADWSIDGRTVTFKLTKDLRRFGELYNIKIAGGQTNGIKDTLGNALDISNNPTINAPPGTYISVFTTKTDPKSGI